MTELSGCTHCVDYCCCVVIYYHNTLCVCAVTEQFLPGWWPNSRKDCIIIPEPFKQIFSEGVVLNSNFQVFLSSDQKGLGMYNKTSLKLRVEKEVTVACPALTVVSSSLTVYLEKSLVDYFISGVMVELVLDKRLSFMSACGRDFTCKMWLRGEC